MNRAIHHCWSTSLWFGLCIIALMPLPLSAQEIVGAKSGVSQSGALTVYDETYFAQFEAITAEDLLKRIPGIQDVLADAQAVSTQRGFGSTGAQILFNGHRLSGKSMTVGSALQRIQVGQVQKIEVIRGAIQGLDIRNEGTVVNVVLKDILVTGSGSWEGRLSHFTSIGIKPGGKLSYSGTVGALNYVAGLEVVPRFDRRDRTKLFYLPANPRSQIVEAPPVQRVYEDMHTETTDIIGSGSLSYALVNGDLLNFNGRYADTQQDESLPSDTYNLFRGGETFVGRNSNFRDLGTKNWEVGGDYNHLFGGGDTFKLLGIHTTTTQNDERRFFGAPPGIEPRLTRIQTQLPHRTESILRGQYHAQLTPTQSIDAGAEGAFNSLNSKIQLLTVNNGIQTDVPLFNPDAIIKETRLETFATYALRPVPSLSIETSLDTEYSRLTQTGRDANARRNFFFVKPRLDVRYDVAPRNQVRARVQRTISQLDFADFVSGFNTDATRLEVLRAGNPDLVPEKQWLYELFYEHRLAADLGVVTLRGYYGDVSDRIEQIPVGTTILAATGNIGSGHYFGAEIKLGLRLGWIGLPTASIDATGYVQDSKVVDSFTGQERNFVHAAPSNWTLNFRHDTSWHNFSYGVGFANRGYDYILDPNAFYTYNQKPVTTAFAEVKTFRDIILRLDVTRVFLPGARGERFVYVGHRGLTPVNRYELSKSDFPREIRLSLRGSF